MRELLQSEDIAYREEPRAGRDGVERGEIWIAAAEQNRVLALLAAAQAEAEAAAQRETAPLEAEESRAAAEAARAAERAAHAAAVEAHHVARRAAKEARRQERRRPWLALRRSRASVPQQADPPSVAPRILGGALVALILLFTLITLVGERWGTHRPTPGHDGKTIPCNRKYDVLCVPP